VKTMTTAQARNAFGQFLGMAQREPVLVTRNDRPVGVFLSLQVLEDTIWGEQALRAHAEGYVGKNQSSKLLTSLTSGSEF
jgi:PHD/YefM family antitoxin component YafN of YafNO toxin-antitoxin module